MFPRKPGGHGFVWVIVFFLVFFLAPRAGAQSGPEALNAGGELTPREEFFKRYRHRLAPSNPLGDPATDPRRLEELRKRREQIDLQRDLMRERQEKARETRMDRIDSEKARMQGKAADKEMKQKEEQDARRDQIQKRAAEQLETKQERLDQRHQTIIEKSQKHRQEMQQHQKAYLERTVTRRPRLPRTPLGVDQLPESPPAPGASGSPAVPDPAHISGAVTPPPPPGPPPHISGTP